MGSSPPQCSPLLSSRAGQLDISPRSPSLLELIYEPQETERAWEILRDHWAVRSDNVGWKSFLKEDPTEFQDLPLVWEEDSPVPAWLTGTYVRWCHHVTMVREVVTDNWDLHRNGPAQISFGSPRRILTSWLDGFAKLHSFKELLSARTTFDWHGRHAVTVKKSLSFPNRLIQMIS